VSVAPQQHARTDTDKHRRPFSDSDHCSSRALGRGRLTCTSCHVGVGSSYSAKAATEAEGEDCREELGLGCREGNAAWC
jgi:hypothetical protein